MEIRNLKTFLTVANLSSFKRAGEHLNYAQSSISAQIKVLEEEIGCSLFERNGRSIALSRAGKDLERYARKIVDIEKEALTSAAGKKESHGLISLRIPQTLSTYYLPGLIKRFRCSYPLVNFDVSSCEYALLPQELASGITDLAFLLTDSVDFSLLKTEFLGTVNLVLIASKESELATKNRVSVRDLAGYPMIFPKHDCSYKMHFQQMLSEEKVAIGPVIEMNSVEAIKHCVIGNLGVSLLPDISVSEDIKTGRMAVLAWELDQLESAILMIWHREKWLSPILKSFMNETRRFFTSGHINIKER